MRVAMKDSNVDGKMRWDRPLNNQRRKEWEDWTDSLRGLERIKIPRAFYVGPKESIQHASLHVFGDASEIASAVVAYLRTLMKDGSIRVSFVCGESKIAPKNSATVPRLELCAMVQASIVGHRVENQLKTKLDDVCYYSDSTVALAYLFNETKRFKNYVVRRKTRILRNTTTSQWHHIEGSINPADLATRPVAPSTLISSLWLTGPEFLHEEPLLKQQFDPHTLSNEPLPDTMDEPSRVLKSKSTNHVLDVWLTQPTRWFKTWATTHKMVTRLLAFIRQWRQKATGKHIPSVNTDLQRQATFTLVRLAQRESFPDLSKSSNLSGIRSNLSPLAPFKDQHDLIRVGGRLKLSSLPGDLKHPLLLPKSHRITDMLSRHFHGCVLHQGKYITTSALRQHGFHIEGMSHYVTKLINSCGVCRRLRAKIENPIMADLPSDRTEPGPPFSAVGIDVMGPWHVASGPKTRRNSTTKKVWALLVTCMASRAVHVETLESMDTPTLMNALKRVISIRGKISMIRSDQGTNFVGAQSQEDCLTVLGSKQTSEAMTDLGVDWNMNPPHASHWGGVFERKIGQIRRGMDSTMMHTKHRNLTAEELRTLLMEAAFIVNSTPLWSTNADPNEPLPITPNLLLTQKGAELHSTRSFEEPDLLSYGPRRWRRIQALADIFWKQWRDLYLMDQQKRSKWTKNIPPLQEGDVVIIKDENTARAYWPLARVEKTYRSHDGVIRKADLRMARLDLNKKPRYLTRPCSQMVRIFSENSPRAI